MLTGCCLVLKNRSVTKSAVSARFWLSVSDTFQTQLLLTMLRVRGGSGLLFLSPGSSCQHHLLLSWRQLLPWVQLGSSLDWILGIYLQIFVFNPLYCPCIDLIFNFNLSNRAGLGFGCEQGADGCWFGWLYLGTSTGGHQIGQNSHSRERGLSDTFQCHSGLL